MMSRRLKIIVAGVTVLLIVLGVFIVRSDYISGLIVENRLRFIRAQVEKGDLAVTSSKEGSELYVPEELDSKFDVTKNKLRFVILGVDKDGGTVDLQVVWPEAMLDSKYSSKIDCAIGDIKTIDSEGKIVENINRDKLFDYIENKTDKDNLLFAGSCSDSSCVNINKGCELYGKNY